MISIYRPMLLRACPVKIVIMLVGSIRDSGSGDSGELWATRDIFAGDRFATRFPVLELYVQPADMYIAGLSGGAAGVAVCKLVG